MSEIVPEPAVDAPEALDEPKVFDADYVASLRKEAAKYRTEAKANAAAKAKLEEIERANLTELEQAKRAAEAAEARARELEQANIRQAVGLAKSIPAALVDRLRGETREELEADADALLALIGAGKPDTSPAPRMRPDMSQGGKQGAAIPLNGDGIEAALRSKLGIS